MYSDKIIENNKIENIKDNNIVFVSGVFDLLHIGHIEFLRSAKKLVGDSGKLVIAIHDDESVKSKKGGNRPLMNHDDRANILAELESVDFVIKWIGWENVVDLVKELKPQYLAITSKSFDHSKEGKWQGDGWQDVANSIGAELVTIPTVANHSSSKLIELID